MEEKEEIQEKEEKVVAKTNQRRKLIVNPELQGRIIANVSWPPAVALAITALLLGVFSMRLLDEAMVAKIELPSVTPILVIVIGFLLLSVIYLIFNALKFSHRIAGPMYRLLRTMEAAKQGDLSARANLRPGDFLVEMAESLNEFLDEMERQRSQAADLAHGLDGPVEDIDFEDLVGPQGRGRGKKPAAEPEPEAEPPASAGAEQSEEEQVTADVKPEHPPATSVGTDEPDPSQN